MIVFRRMKQNVSLVPTVFDKLVGFLLTWNGQSLDQQEKHHEPVTSTATELFSLKSSQGKSQLIQCSSMSWVSGSGWAKHSRVTYLMLLTSLLQYKQEYCIEDTSSPPEDSILNACLASIIDLALLCSRAAPDERIPMSDVAVKLNKIKSYYNTREDPNFLLEAEPAMAWQRWKIGK